MRTPALAAAAALLLTACGATVVPGPRVDLAIGDAVILEDLQLLVEFTAVEADSRCPRAVACVWAGDAAVRLRLASPSTDTVVTLHTGADPREFIAPGVRIVLEELAPYPEADGPIPTDAYRLRLDARAR